MQAELTHLRPHHPAAPRPQLLHRTMPSAALLLALLVPVAEPLGLPGPANAFTWGGRGTLLGYELSLPALVAILGSAALGCAVAGG